MHFGHGMWGWGHGWGHGWFGGIPMLLFWVLVFMLLAKVMSWVFNSSAEGREGVMGSNDPLEILKRRYARGEIEKIEFEERRRELRN